MSYMSHVSSNMSHVSSKMTHVSPTARECSQKGSVVVKRCGVFLVMSNACCVEKTKQKKRRQMKQKKKSSVSLESFGIWPFMDDDVERIADDMSFG